MNYPCLVTAGCRINAFDALPCFLGGVYLSVTVIFAVAVKLIIMLYNLVIQKNMQCAQLPLG